MQLNRQFVLKLCSRMNVGNMSLTRVIGCLVVLAVGVCSQHHYVAPHYITRSAVIPSPYYAHHTPPIDPYSKYAFGYSVADPYTGVHNRVEEKNGPVIKGAYQVVEHDGSLRTVKYSADPLAGFQAIVDKGPLPVRDLQKLPYKLF